MQHLLIAGFGDIARRALPALQSRFQVTPLSRRYGVDLDRPLEPRKADGLLHCAPPPSTGSGDPRTAHLLAALQGVRRIVYISTSGVYGDCGGALVDEARAVNPQTERARRRVHAERQLERCGVALVVPRAPGIYAADRLPLDRLRAGTPVLRSEDNVYTNHIHADDLAAIVCRALDEDAPAGIYNASDDSVMKMGDWFDLVAEAHALPRPPRIRKALAPEIIAPALLSFMQESRRLDNTRLKRVLGIRLRYPPVHEGLRNERPARLDQPA